MTATKSPPTISARQIELDLRLPAGRPLVPVEAVMVLADRDENSVLSLIERGLLRHAWNIASPGAERREIRVHRDSVLTYLSGDYERITQELSTRERETRALVLDLLPKPTKVELAGGRYQTIRGVELARRFSCSQWLISSLIRSGSIAALEGPKAGPRSSPHVLHDSVVKFLIERRLK